jgi:hypothetical protein
VQNQLALRGGPIVLPRDVAPNALILKHLIVIFDENNSFDHAVCQPSYNAHYAPFQYYLSTANPHHRPPTTSVAAIGHSDQASHQYSFDDFWEAVRGNRLPSVVFLKPSVTQTGHPAASSPLAEQQLLVETINRLLTVSLDSSDIPVILEALEFRKASLERTASRKLESEQHPTVLQIDLLINTLKSIQP